jgi:bifunctional non-homologous end joining protein LigD
VAHWKKVGKQALAHLARRPLAIGRQPVASVPKAVHKVRIDGEDRFWIDSVEGLLGLVEIGAVELSALNATIDDLERPDQLVFALPARDWRKAVDIAMRLRTLLKAEGLESWPKLTGGPELHVMVPIEPDLDWQEAQRYSEDIAKRLASTAIDCRYNRRGATVIAAFSPRALPHFPIAAAVEWKELPRIEQPDAFKMQEPRGRKRL